MKLEVGMYVRTDKVGIKKIYEIDNYKTKYKYLYKLKKQDDDGCIDLGALCENNIIKASYNIIGLIEVGDYVNGNEIYKINWDSLGLILETTDYFKLREKDIKSIITKEQMEQISYRIGE